MGEKILESLSRADWTVLLIILIALIAMLWTQNSKNETILKEIKDLGSDISGKHKDLGGDISDRHIGLGSDVSGKYKNLGEKISSEHMSIKNNTEYIQKEIKDEKLARQNLYNNTTRAKEILDTMDMMREVVVQNAKLNAEVSDLKIENHKLSNDENGHNFKNLSNDIRRFEGRLSEFENFNETEEIRAVLKKILTELSEYDN